MCQDDVKKYLEEYPNRAFSQRELEEALGNSRVRSALKSLKKNDEVEFYLGAHPPKGGRQTLFYKHKSSKSKSPLINVIPLMLRHQKNCKKY